MLSADEVGETSDEVCETELVFSDDDDILIVVEVAVPAQEHKTSDIKISVDSILLTLNF